MIAEPTKRLQYLCDVIPVLLVNIPEEDLSRKPAPGKWSKKEILGHLIDSATNNHQRFVRAQFENIPTITYDQNNWNSCSHYNEISGKHLILFWAIYNRHLVELIKRIPPEHLTKECNTGYETNYTIEWLIDDYVRHLEHHLKQITEYK
jgi:hypothetical protein